MFRRGWEQATGTVVGSEITKLSTYVGMSGYTTATYVVDVHPADGPAFRAKFTQSLSDPAYLDLVPGAKVPVQFDPKSQKTRIDGGALKHRRRDRDDAHHDRLDDLAKKGPGPA